MSCNTKEKKKHDVKKVVQLLRLHAEYKKKKKKKKKKRWELLKKKKIWINN